MCQRKCHANARDTDPDPYRHAIPISVRHGLKPLLLFYLGLEEFLGEAIARRVTRGTSRAGSTYGGVQSGFFLLQ
jgi:hypothetical protein